MKRTMLTVLLAVLAVLLLCSACAGAETLKIDGTERADLRSSPNGSVIARFFGGVPADRLETKGKWSRVRIGQDPVSVTGWIRNEFLAPVESGEILYCGQDCIPARGHGTVALLESRKKGSQVLDTWDGTNGETIYTVAGISSGNEWLMVARTGESGAAEWFFAAGDALATFDGVYVKSREADSVVSLRAEPNTKAKILESCFGGVPADILFDFEGKEGWTRICVGGVAGYMMNDFLEEMEFDVPAWRPPLAALGKQTARVYAGAAGNDPLIGGEVLTEYDVFCVLGRGKTRHHICIDTGKPDACLYGWIDDKDLKTTNLTGGSTAGLLVRDTEVLNWDGEVCRTLRAGQEVRFRWFYGVFPSEGTAAVLDYCDLNTSRWVWVDASVEADPDAEWDPDAPAFIEEWGIGFIPVDAVQIDPNLVLPSPMGNG